jgi:hypothetical protein
MKSAKKPVNEVKSTLIVTLIGFVILFVAIALKGHALLFIGVVLVILHFIFPAIFVVGFAWLICKIMGWRIF